MLEARELHSGASRFASATDPLRGITLLADVRIGNRDTLIEALGASREVADTDLILQAYARWGENLADFLVGEFAIVAIDRRNRRIDLFRDHIGTRPIFFRRSPGRLEFGAEIAPFVADASIAVLDDAAVASAVMGGRRTDPGETFYRSVERLRAGHRLSWHKNRFDIVRWWNPFDRPRKDVAEDDALIDEGRALLRDAVSALTVDAGKIAAHVTGGLDSSAVLALVAHNTKALSEPLVGYGWQGPGETDEGPRIGAAIAMQPIDFRAPQLSEAQLSELWHWDWTTRPSIWNLLHELAVQRDARRSGIDTILSGWGGDEAISFNGRGLHAELLRSFDLAGLASLSSRSGPTALLSSTRTAMREIAGSHENLPSQSAHSFLSAEFLASVDMPPMRRVDMSSCRQMMQSILELGGMTERIEDWAISGRENGLNYRYPLLDRRVMEFAYSLPGKAFRQGSTRRWLFREMMRGILPEPIRTENSKAEDSRTRRMIGRIQQSLAGLADEIEDRRNSMRRAHYFDIDRLVAALRAPPGFGDGRLGHLRRAIQFLDL